MNAYVAASIHLEERNDELMGYFVIGPAESDEYRDILLNFDFGQGAVLLRDALGAGENIAIDRGPLMVYESSTRSERVRVVESFSVSGDLGGEMTWTINFEEDVDHKGEPYTIQAVITGKFPVFCGSLGGGPLGEESCSEGSWCRENLVPYCSP